MKINGSFVIDRVGALAFPGGSDNVGGLVAGDAYLATVAYLIPGASSSLTSAINLSSAIFAPDGPAPARSSPPPMPGTA